jgi:glucose uptake protein
LVLPTTYAAAILLLILSFICFGSWANMLKLCGSQWRFELFYFDFAIAAVLLAVLAAFTFGTLGSEMAFNDRILVAGRSAQAYAIAAGFLFNLGNMLLLAAVSLLGISAAFLLSTAVALIVACCFDFRPDNILLLVSGMVLLLITLVLGGSACRVRELMLRSPAKPAPRSGTRAPAKHGMKRTSKGLLTAILAGIPRGFLYPLFTRATAGEFGLGPYAGILLFCIGLLLSTIVFNFYFMNIAIEGGPLSFGSYFRGNLRQHLLGFAGGALWIIAALAAALALTTQSQLGVPLVLAIILPIASALLAAFWGLTTWREFPASTRNARVAITFTTVLFAGALALTGSGLAR